MKPGKFVADPRPINSRESGRGLQHSKSFAGFEGVAKEPSKEIKITILRIIVTRLLARLDLRPACVHSRGNS
jgi:hypothetical protein